MKAVLRVAGISLAVLAAVLALLLVLVANFNWNRAKPWLSEQISSATGREFVIDGPLTVDWRPPPETQGWRQYLPWPHFRARDVRLGNPDWADSGPWMLTAPQVNLSLNLPRLLSRELRIERLRLAGAQLVLEKQGPTRRNWQFAPRDSDSGWEVRLEQLGIADGKLRYLAPQQQTDLRLQLATRKDGGVDWQVAGRYNAEPLRGQGRSGSLLALRGSKVRYPFDARLTLGDTRVVAQGSITDPADPSAIDVRLRLQGASMADLFVFTGLLLPETPKFTTEGRLVGQLQPGRLDLRYEAFSGRVGKSDIAGTLRYRQQAPRPRLEGTLVSKQLRLADLGRLIGIGDDGGGQPGEFKQPKGRVLPVSRFRTDRWDAMDVRVRLTGREIIRPEALPIDSLDTLIVMQDGVLTLDPLRFGVAGGKLSGSLRIDGRSDPAQGRIDWHARGVNLARLFPAVGDAPASIGKLGARATLSGAGNSVAALLGTADGELGAVVDQGSVSKLVLEAAGLNLASAAIALIFGDRQIPLNCLVADFRVRQGIAKPTVFLLDTPAATLRMTGAINLQTERYDLTIHPQSKGMRLLSLRSPLHVRGSFEDPDVALDKGAIALKAGAAALLGAAAAPLAGLLALVNPGGAAESPCAKLLEQGGR